MNQRPLQRHGAACWSARFVHAAMLSAAVATPMAYAQTPAPAAPEQPAPASGQVFEPVYFERFSPQTAADMIRNIPGFSLEGGREQRGFGQGGANVLINGRRVSGKSNGTIDALGRVAAASVIRIEIVDGAGLSIPGLSGQVANVVVKPKGLSGQWESTNQFRSDTRPSFNGRASLSGENGPLTWSVQARAFGGRGAGVGTETVTNAAGLVTDFRRERNNGGGIEPGLSADLTYSGRTGDIFNFNASVEFPEFGGLEVSRRSGPGQPDRLRVFRDKFTGWRGEIGSDYEFGLGPGRLKLIGLQRVDHDDSFSELIQQAADASALTGSRFLSAGESGESIARAEYSLSGPGGGDWQGALEGAFNFSESNSRNQTLTSGAFVNSGTPDLTRVEEKRAEASITHSRKLTPAIDLQVSLAGEYSELSQDGPGGQTREFVRPKGFASLAWKPDPDFDLNLRFAREVGQLRFSDFAASQDLADDILTSGNAELVPEQSWRAQLEANRRFGAWGAVKLKLSASDIEDVVDQTPIFLCNGVQVPSATACLAPATLVRRSGVGNLPSAERYSAELAGTLHFDPLGLKGLQLEFEASVGDSKLIDPLTGEERKISGTPLGGWEAVLRQDVPGTDLSWGAGFEHNTRSSVYRLDQRSRSFSGAFAFAFVEHKDLFGLKVRLQAANLTDRTEGGRREVYVGDRLGPLNFIEEREQTFSQIFRLQISDTF